MRLVFVLFLLSAFALTDGAQFLSPLPDGTVLYACAGSGVTLSWQYELSQGDQINYVRWYYKGSNNTLIAYYSHGTFLPLPAFAQRVEFVANGGLELRNLATSDSGRYFVEISGVDGKGQVFQHVRHVLLQVADGLRTTNGRLAVSLQKDPILDTTTGEWSLVLSCGRFTYSGQPAFPIEWVTPSGRAVESSKYEDGNFKLHLTTSSVEGGRYVCRVPTNYTSSACLSDSQAAAEQVAITVDKMDARVTLITAELAALKQQQSNDTATLSRLVNDAVVPLVAFHARSGNSQHLNYGANIKFNIVYYNQGNGYNSTTGEFTAPVSGTYSFSFQTQNHNGYYAYAYVYVNGQYVCDVYTTTSSISYGNAYCSGIRYLARGQKAWVGSLSNNNYFSAYRTAFSGFLINDGP